MTKDDNFLATILLIIVASLVAPLILIPIEKVLPYPFVIEEIAKVFLIIIILKSPEIIRQISLLLMAGFLFAFSESAFYLGSVYGSGNQTLFVEKLFTTYLLHTATLIILYLPTIKDKRLIFLFLPVSMFVHYLFNARGLPF